MARIAPIGSGGAGDPADPDDVDLEPDGPSEFNDDEPTFDGPDDSGDDNRLDAVEQDPGNDVPEPDPPETSGPRVPQGVQNPFNSDVEDGDIVGADPNAVDDDGNVAGGDTLVEDDGSLDFNPTGDTTVDPTDADYESEPGRDSGAVERATPDTEITEAFGGDSDDAGATPEQAADIIDSVSSSVNDRAEMLGSTASAGASWVRGALLVALVGVVALIAGGD